MADLYGAITRGIAYGLALVSPKRAYSFYRNSLSFRSFVGATSDGPNKSWRPSNASADELLKKDHKLLRSRARDLARNSSHVKGALRKLGHNVVYRGIWPQARLKEASGELKQKQNERIEQAFRAWAKTKEVRLVALERLALWHLWQDGELLVHYFYDPDLEAKGRVPLGVELMECDHLDESVHGELGNGNTAKRGIEYNALGRPVAYHLFPEHPGDASWLAYGRTVRVPAERIDHIYMKDRASQHRGSPWMDAVIMEMRDYSEYQSSERLAARLASAFGIFVKTPYPEQLGTNPLGGDGSTGADGMPDYLEPAGIHTLPVGTDITAAQFQRPTQSYEPFTKTTLRGASTGFNMSYEAYSNDYTDASYASARSGALEERRGYQCMQQFLIDELLSELARRWVAMARVTGRQIPLEVPMEWTTPGWPWVDPQKDARAAETELRLGITTRRKLCADRGLDWDEVVSQLAREREQLAESGIEAPDKQDGLARGARPLPEPESDEDEEDWLDRCMGDPVMQSEYPQKEQRLAVCESIWEDSKEEA